MSTADPHVRTDEADGLTAIVGAAKHAVKRMAEEDEYWRQRRDAGKYVGDHDPRGGR
ncbi:hypothetical protein [Streptomyces sp. ITFR-6]|uniref:hypothetical protein n=1 Tax=Streptomyces sp. ITFR-6 TaxID=3075197 RepID=UPI00288B5917|nr:hypothetical protein [Streptomyces sp. ITFR-6]WNI28634.1 hypothetical protein RLT59_07410 [Streptomyces sp. ITFR-6]